MSVSEDDNAAPDSASDPKARSKSFVIGLSILSCIGGFLFGYDTGVISGAMLILKDEFHLNTLWQELVVSVTVGAAAIFSLVAGVLNDVIGRRPVILAASFVFTLGSLILGASEAKSMLLVGRFVVGIGIGLASMTVPMYIAEVSTPDIRGRLVTMNTLFICGGQFTASLVDGGFNYVHEGWRYMLGLAGIPSLIQFIGFIFMPESPRYLTARGKPEEALRVLLKIRGGSVKIAQEELASIQASLDETEEEERGKGVKKGCMSLLTLPHMRRAVIVGCALQLFQQVSGINTVMYYSATIIAMSGVKGRDTVMWLSAMTAGVNFAFTFVGMFFVERVGRRLLTLVSLFGVSLALAFLGISFYVMSLHSPVISNHDSFSIHSICYNATTCDSCIAHQLCGFCFMDNETNANYDGYCLPTLDQQHTDQTSHPPCNGTLSPGEHLTFTSTYCPTAYSWMPIVGLVLYLVCFAPGMGPMPWTINSELYPQWARSTAISMATTTNWLANLAVSISFLSLMEIMSKHGAYFMYAGIAFLGFIFFLILLPETKGRSLEEIETLFLNPWSSCGSPSDITYVPLHSMDIHSHTA